MPLLKHSLIFPLIAQAINDIWEAQHTWVSREQIIKYLMKHSEVLEVFETSGISFGMRGPDWYVGNAVDWFSKRITDRSSEYVDVFERRKISGKWAYAPMGFAETESESLFGDATKRTYKRGAEIGRGAFGIVYRGEMLVDGNPRLTVAIKSYLTDFNEKEFKILSELNHPNIIRLLDTYESADSRGHKLRSLVFEYADGGTLKDKIENFPDGIPIREALSMLLDIAKGLFYLHTLEQRIIHRDIKPANILFVKERACISDVGLAKLIDTTTMTHSGGQTLAYAAPELLPLGPGQKLVVSPKVDIYSLGITAYQMLTGKLPFATWNPGEMIWHHHNSSIPAHANVLGWAKTLIDNCTSKDYHERWSSEELLSFLEHEFSSIRDT